MTPDDSDLPKLPEGVLAVRLGPGANCSSIGSVVDILFVSATVGGALLAALAAVSKPSLPAESSADAAEPVAPTPPSQKDAHDGR